MTERGWRRRDRWMPVCCRHPSHVAVCLLDNVLHTLRRPVDRLCDRHDRNLAAHFLADSRDGRG